MPTTPYTHHLRRLAPTLLCLAASAGHADVRYQFLGSLSIDHYLPQQFVLDVPDYITTHTVFQASELTSCLVWNEPCQTVEFIPRDINQPWLSTLAVKSDGLTGIYYFVPAAFTQPGTYTMVYSDQFNPATLTVTGPAVPEPAMAWMFFAGLVVLTQFKRHA